MLQLLVLLLAIAVYDPPIVADPNARLSGFYVTTEKGNLLPVLEFKGERIVVIHSFISAAATYTRDAGYVLVEESGKSPMLFRVQNADTIIGESTFAKGTYRRVSADELAEIRRTRDDDAPVRAPPARRQARRNESARVRSNAELLRDAGDFGRSPPVAIPAPPRAPPKVPAEKRLLGD